MNRKELFTQIPKVDEMLNRDDIKEVLESQPRQWVTDIIRETIEETRLEIRQLDEKTIDKYEVSEMIIADKIIKTVKKKAQFSLKRVVNATGVVIHTNLGRSLISESIKEHLTDISCYFSTLEFDLETGKRGSRYNHIEELVCRLTGGEAALVVNNNAAAVMLALSTLSNGKESIVSRGQLVEIGGSFRIPDVMKQSGALMIEVGTTNKTHLRDYEEAITDNTAILLKVHTSNYRVLGFTQEVSVAELAELGKRHNIPVVEDIGSGSLIDYSKYGLTKEPTVAEALSDGADVVTFSGDKMLGGPQAGFIVGKKEFIEKMKKNQLTRALRIDKMTLAVLEATLKLYLDEEKAVENIPTLHMLTMAMDEIETRATAIYDGLKAKELPLELEIIDGESEVGGGSMPLEKLPTKLISLTVLNMSTNKLVKKLRDIDIPIICRISDEKILIDPRTLKDSEVEILVKGFEQALNS